MERIIEETRRTLPTLAACYDFLVDEQERAQHRTLRGPEYLLDLRRYALDLGVRVLDPAPARALLCNSERRVIGAAGCCRRRTGPGRSEAAP